MKPFTNFPLSSFLSDYNETFLEKTFHYIEYVLNEPLARATEECEDETTGTALDEFPEYFTCKLKG